MMFSPYTIDKAFSENAFFSLFFEILDQHNNQEENKVEDNFGWRKSKDVKVEKYYWSEDSFEMPTTKGISLKHFDSEKFRNSITLKNHVRSFERDLKKFLKKLPFYFKETLFEKLEIFTYDNEDQMFGKSKKEEGHNILEARLVERAKQEYENVYIKYIENLVYHNNQYSGKNDYASTDSVPYGDVYSSTFSSYGPDNYTAAVNPDDKTKYLEASDNLKSTSAPEDPLLGFIYRLQYEKRYYRIGVMLEKIYNTIKDVDMISAKSAMAHTMRISAILPFITKTSCKNISAYMFNNYNWMDQDSLYPLESAELVDKIKEEFKNIIYSKNPQNLNKDQFANPAEYTGTAGKRYDTESANLDYGTSFAIKSSNRLSTGNVIDDTVSYLITSENPEYKKVGRQISTVVAYILDDKKFTDNDVDQLKEMMSIACQGITKEMALDITRNTVSEHASFTPEQIARYIVKDFNERLSKKTNKGIFSRMGQPESTRSVGKILPSSINDSSIPNKSSIGLKSDTNIDQREPFSNMSEAELRFARRQMIWKETSLFERLFDYKNRPKIEDYIMQVYEEEQAREVGRGL